MLHGEKQTHCYLGALHDGGDELFEKSGQLQETRPKMVQKIDDEAFNV